MLDRIALLACFLGACTTRADDHDGGTPPNVSCTRVGDENTASACADGVDNDCNGAADCDEFDCCGLLECSAPTVCSFVDVTICGNPVGEDTLAACGDAVDNDCDGYLDCNDYDCCPDRTPVAGLTCSAGTSCNTGCPGGSGDENTVDACGNDCDDDGDGYVDCADFNCCQVVTCEGSAGCPQLRDAGAGCAFQARENTAALCANGADDDCDGYVDCNDYGCCRHVTCGTGTSCGDR